MTKRWLPWLAFWVCAMLALGCQPKTSPGGHAAPSAAQSAADDSQAERDLAVFARDDLFQRLSTRLMEAMTLGGPAAAIPVCKEDAPRIAADVGREHGVEIGRTSFRLRNPSNTPPPWTVDFVEQRVEEPRFVDLPGGGTGALLPIHLQPLCATCHGMPDQVAEDVKHVLAEQYPEDQATGFEVGELRGWFWVEVPGR